MVQGTSTWDSLDMSLYWGTPEEKAQFCASLLETLKTKGVAKVKNHGIPDEQIRELFDVTRKFFELPYDEKMVAKHPPTSNPNRGYSFIGQENVAAISKYGKAEVKTHDIKETFDMGASTDLLEANRWPTPSTLPAFRPFMETFYTSAFALENHLLSALALALDISPSDLHTMHSAAENEFRILHYPTVPASTLADPTATRIAEHTDFGTLTLLFQDSTGGLQVEDQQHPGNFHDVPPSVSSDLIINIGDSLQRLTNDTFRAACHRVTFPAAVVDDNGVEVIPGRYSAAYFAKPNRAASLRPIGRFVSEERPCRYGDETAWEWNMKRIKALFPAEAPAAAAVTATVAPTAVKV
ncbi:Clavaminate synthase-like protein [Aaosphaeria arxii CBS 175.79]|uniref:Clavaminate synthase-like protein n=1 Tax=Aaosphaeria arxii CBS 175.79 TaxID=1450172 RepID=A0A6A5XLI4_9PLEO|nr:Clavaminate synthase-like protein [Aaosphaeria arxii CBS 175.79]KAF2014012.1 Clavaminate synthase-like protein [Aaosphaeria arxii CBS 175.79]